MANQNLIEVEIFAINTPFPSLQEILKHKLKQNIQFLITVDGRSKYAKGND